MLKTCKQWLPDLKKQTDKVTQLNNLVTDPLTRNHNTLDAILSPKQVKLGKYGRDNKKTALLTINKLMTEKDNDKES